MIPAIVDLTITVQETPQRRRTKIVYKVLAVGAKVRMIKVGDMLDETELDCATDIGYHLKRVRKGENDGATR